MRETSNAGVATGVHPRRRRFLRVALDVAGGLLLFATGLGVMWLLRPVPPRASVARVSLDVRPTEELHGAFEYTGATPGGYPTGLTWTPDGQALVFVGRRAGVQQLYVRRLDAAEARPPLGTEGAALVAISADGRWVAFWARGTIRKVPVGGGPVMTLVSGLTVPPWGLVWDAHGRLFYGGEARPIWQIPAEGTPAAVTTVADGEVSHGLPWPLPGERALLYTVRKRGWSWGDEEVVAQTLATGVRKVLLKDATDARYVPTGHLVFLRRGQLFAVPFDAERLEVRGTPQAVLDEVAQALTAGDSRDITGAGQFAIAATGTLAWVSSPVVPHPDAATVGRSGHVSPLPAPMRSYGPAARASPDGRQLAVTIQTLTEAGVWVYDVGRGSLTLLAGGGEATFPVWSPDGRGLVFDWLADGRPALASKPADAVDAATPPQVLLPGLFFASSFTRDGRQVAAVKYLFDIVIETVEDGQTRVQPLIQTPNTEQWPEFSPDGRWLVYGSNVSGRFEVYVRPYPSLGTTDAVSLEGGYCPAWHPSGRELFFLSRTDPSGKRRMMAVDFAPGPPRASVARVCSSSSTQATSSFSALRCAASMSRPTASASTCARHGLLHPRRRSRTST